MPLHELARWPAWEIDILEHFIARDPPPEVRLEFMLAELTANFVNANKEKGAKPSRPKDFMHYMNVWSDDSSYSDIDKEVIENLL